MRDAQSDRWLVLVACIPMAFGVALLLTLARVPARALSAETPATHTGATQPPEARAASQWVGVVVASSTAELAASAAGRVDGVYVRTGDAVKRGDRLARFDCSEVSGSVELASAQLGERDSALQRARARAQAAASRLDRLRAGKAWLSKQEFEGAEEDLRVANAELRTAEATLSSGRIELQQQRLRRTRYTLTAPFDGRVIALDVDRGDSVGAGQVVMRIHSMERKVRFAVPPEALSGLGQRQLSLRLEGHSETVHTQVERVRPEVDPSAELVIATASLPTDLPSPESWIPGARVRVATAE